MTADQDTDLYPNGSCSNIVLNSAINTVALARAVEGGTPGELLPSAGDGVSTCVVELDAAAELVARACLAEVDDSLISR